MKLSIIIPIYCVEKYIERCLMSCILQDYQIGVNYEIICINDGTTDKSAEIARMIARQYKGIIVINQDNAGLSVARNNGLKKACGEYIWFVDSDDWIEPDSLSHIIPKLKDGLDILHINYQLAFDNKPPQQIYDCSINGIIDGRTQIISRNFQSPAQFSIYRKEFLLQNNIEFYKDILHEDSEFKPRAILLAKKISSCNKICYNYYQREGSIMSSYKLRNAHDMLIVLNSLKNFVEPYDDKVKSAIYFKMSLLINNIMNGYKKLNIEDQARVIDLLNNNKHLFRLMLRSGSLKYICEGLALLIDVKSSMKIYNKIF